MTFRINPPPPPADVCQRPCDCVIRGYDPGEHPDGVHSWIQLLPTCPVHGDFFADTDPDVTHRLMLEVEVSWLRARLDGRPAAWRSSIHNRLNPVPGKGFPIHFDTFVARCGG